MIAFYYNKGTILIGFFILFYLNCTKMTATINVCVPLIHYALWICVPEDYSWAHCASASRGCYLDIPEHNAIVKERFFKNKV